MTQRQFAAWQEWLREEWNDPDRADHYQMQMTAEVRLFRIALLGGNKSDLEPDKFKIGFEFKAPNKKGESGAKPQQQQQQPQPAVAALIGAGAKVKTVKRSEIVFPWDKQDGN